MRESPLHSAHVRFELCHPFSQLMTANGPGKNLTPVVKVIVEVNRGDQLEADDLSSTAIRQDRVNLVVTVGKEARNRGRKRHIDLQAAGPGIISS